MINWLRYLLLICCFFASVRAFNNVSVYEDTDNLLFFELDTFINNGFTYPDGTGLLQLLRYNASDNDLYIRLLHPNGTLTKFTVPTYNVTKYEPHAFPLNDGYMLVVTQLNDSILHGTLVDWSGQVLQR